MSTVIRPELSPKNEYFIDKHRYYELKHFCLQYNEWKKAYYAIDGFATASSITSVGTVRSDDTISDVTAKCAIAKEFYMRRIQMIENAAKAVDVVLYKYIIKAVTEELSFTYLKTTMGIPCGRSTYYKLYRKFFWLLNDIRD